MSREDSRDFLQSLTDFVVSDPSRVYVHEWSVGDTVVWDNRSQLHRATPYKYDEPRVLTATRVAGDVPHELAYYPDSPEVAMGREVLAKELVLLHKEVSGKFFGEATTAEVTLDTGDYQAKLAATFQTAGKAKL